LSNIPGRRCDLIVASHFVASPRARILNSGRDTWQIPHKLASARAKPSPRTPTTPACARACAAVKAVRKAIDAGDKAAAAEIYKQSQVVIDSIADKKIVHKNKAARHKSRLSAAIKAMAA
jgi:small subunit ribosomal protein S20